MSCNLTNIFVGSGQNCFDSPGVKGPCKAAFKKWTYDGGICKEFLYGGCRGNENLFDSLSQCQALCGGGGGQGGTRENQGGLDNSRISDKVSPCSFAPFVFGSCSFSLTKWSYVDKTRSCQAWQYSGCSEGIVANRFNSFDECRRMCLV